MAWTATDTAALASGGAAVGTLVLAFFTWRLGAKTGDMAKASVDAVDVAKQELVVIRNQTKATQAQVELSTRAMRASQQPWLVPVAHATRSPESIEFIALTGETTLTSIEQDARCWQEANNGPIWAIIPVRNIGAGPAMIPGDKSVIAQLSLFGGLTGFGRPSTRIIAPGDIAYMVFREKYGYPRSAITIPLRPDELGSTDIVVIRYTGIDTSTITQSRFAYRQFKVDRMLDAIVTIDENVNITT